MIRLAIETSTMTQSVAVERDGRVVAQRSVTRRSGHATSLLLSVEGCLADAEVSKDEIQEILCGLGPGSFTGVRVGVAAAVGLGRGLGVRVGGLSSFDALLALAPPDSLAAIALDARKSEVYAGIWEAFPRGTTLDIPAHVSPSTFFERIATHASRERIVLLGDAPSAYAEAFEPYADRIRWMPAAHTPDAAFLFRAAAYRTVPYNDVQALEPLYIRPSDAELNPRYAPTVNDEPVATK